jgi:4-hydroxyacetophenone monooxygenase
MNLYTRTDTPREEIARILQAADVPVLLMVLYQLTHDTRWLQAPFQPKRDISFFADESGGMPEEVQAQVRAAALDVLCDVHNGTREIPPRPSDEDISRMMSVCMGEMIPGEYVAMMLVEMGLRRRDPEWHA